MPRALLQAESDRRSKGYSKHVLNNGCETLSNKESVVCLPFSLIVSLVVG